MNDHIVIFSEQVDFVLALIGCTALTLIICTALILFWIISAPNIPEDDDDRYRLY